MLEAADLVKAAAQGESQLLGVLRREAQHLGGDVLLAPPGEPCLTTWNRVLCAGARCHAGTAPAKEGSPVHTARLAIARLKKLPFEATVGNEGIKGVKGLIYRRITGKTMDEPPAWALVFTSEFMPEAVVCSHKEDLWPSVGTTIGWRYAWEEGTVPYFFQEKPYLGGYEQDGQLGIGGLRLIAPWFSAEDEWRMAVNGLTPKMGMAGKPFIVCTQHGGVVASPLASILEAIKQRKMAVAIPIATLIRRAFDKMEAGKEDSWSKEVTVDVEGEEEEFKDFNVAAHEATVVVRSKSRGLAVKKNLDELEESVAELRYLGERTEGRKEKLTEAMRRLVDAGLLREAAITARDTRMVLDDLFVDVTKEEIAICDKKHGRSTCPLGPGKYKVKPAMLIIPHEMPASSMKVTQVSGQGYSGHPHLPYAEGRPCFGHGDVASAKNMRLIDVLWDSDIEGFVKWMRMFFTTSNMEAGYLGVWTCAEKVGERDTEKGEVTVAKAITVAARPSDSPVAEAPPTVTVVARR